MSAFALILIVALMVASERREPVIFRYARVGLGGRCFLVLKFRTIRMDADWILAAQLANDPTAAAEWVRDHKLRHDLRTASLESFLHKSSLDELLELINVLVGVISIVDPRLIVEAEIRRYGHFFKGYCSVRPGITGVWQVNGRNSVSYRRRVAVDALYARLKSVLLDLRLMTATVLAVFMEREYY